MTSKRPQKHVLLIVTILLLFRSFFFSVFSFCCPYSCLSCFSVASLASIRGQSNEAINKATTHTNEEKATAQSQLASALSALKEETDKKIQEAKEQYNKLLPSVQEEEIESQAKLQQEEVTEQEKMQTNIAQNGIQMEKVKGGSATTK